MKIALETSPGSVMQAPPESTTAIVDCCVYWDFSSEELYPFLSSGWREFFNPSTLEATLASDNPRFARNFPPLPHYNPEGERLRGAQEDLTMSPSEWLDRQSISHAVVFAMRALSLSTIPSHFFGAELVRAVNRWTQAKLESASDSWLQSVLAVSNQLPEEAIAEIHELGQDDRFAGVLMTGNGLGRPFGHPVYHPIYEAASDLGLPIIVHIHGDSPPDTLTHPTGGGLPGTYVESYVLRAQSVMTHIASMIGQGVFVKFPDLRVLLLGAGVNWLPSHLWRFDTYYKALGPTDAPWLDLPPSEYFRQNVTVSTYALNPPRLTPAMVRALTTVEWVGDVLSFASGYPNWDFGAPSEVAESLPPSWRDGLFHRNAERTLRLTVRRERR